VLHVARTRAEPHHVEALMQHTAEADGRNVTVHIEREPGSEGKLWVDYVRRQLLRGYSVHAEPATGDKGLRIRQLQPIINSGDVDVVLAPWTQAFLDEFDAWPHVDHDDQCDSFGGAHRALTTPKSRIIV
jgi:predicted phage terminase large subunit-like protein